MKSIKIATIKWNNMEKKWIISKYENNGLIYELKFKVKDMNEETEYGWIQEEFISELYDLQQQGYAIQLLD